MEGKVSRNRSRNAVDRGAPPELTTASDLDVWLWIEVVPRVEQGSHDSVPHRAGCRDLLSLDRAPYLARVERARPQDDLVPAEQVEQHHPSASRVHQGSEKQEGALIGRDPLDQLLDRRDLGKGGIATPHTGEEGVLLSPHHAFGQPRWCRRCRGCSDRRPTEGQSPAPATTRPARRRTWNRQPASNAASGPGAPPPSLGWCSPTDARRRPGRHR